MKTEILDSEHTQCPLCDSTNLSLYYRVTRRYLGVTNQLVLIKCAFCGFVFLVNPPDISYNEEYLGSESVLAEGNALALFRANERLASIASYVSPSPDRRFLDIGIGDGLLLSLAEKRGYRTFGLDVNSDGVEIARKQYGLKAEISILPLDQAFPDSSFDVIHMNEVIEHIPQPIPLLEWCRRHLRTGGCLVIQTGNIDSLASQIKGIDWDYIRPVHCSYFSSKSLTYAVEKAKLRMVCRRTVDWRFFPTLKVTNALRRQAGWAKSLRFLFLYLTAIPFGFRRSIIIYAV